MHEAVPSYLRHRPALPYAVEPAASAAAPAPGSRISLFNSLSAPVTVITKGRGVETFRDSSRLMARLPEIVAQGDSILSIRTPVYALSDDSIAALVEMLRTVGFRPFKKAAKDAGNPFGRFGTKWNWRFLGDYLGWEWGAIK